MNPERQLTPEELAEQRLYNLAEAMSKFGGSFAKAIAAAFYRADKNNRKKLLDAFSDLFDEYEPFIGR